MDREAIRSALVEYAHRTPFNTRDLWPQIEGLAVLAVSPKRVERARPRGAGLLRPVITAGALTLALLVAVFWLGRPENTRPLLSSAGDILAEAAKATRSSDVRSLHTRSAQQYSYTDGVGMNGWAKATGESWAVRPNMHREEMNYTIPNGEEFVSLTVGDGNALWRYQSQESDVVLVSEPLTRTLDVTDAARFQQIIDDMGTGKYEAQYLGLEEVAGREAYVIDLTYAEAAGDRKPGREKLWIDRDIFIVLKSEIWNREGTLIWSYVCTTVEVNVDIPRSIFTFDRPAGTTVWDTRPVDEQEAHELWQAAARQAGHPLYMPPATFDVTQFATSPSVSAVAGRPYYDTVSKNVTVPYVTLSPSTLERLAFMPPGVWIEQGTPSTVSIEGDWYDVQVGDTTGRFYTQTDGGVLVLDREGVRIAIRITLYSSHLPAREKAVELAESLAPVYP
ncbi:MAG TPA: outer membrane lipoprotein-sorting protein [Chloroflexia bacterium]|nr:outer membrane lipoprotein-sorting protein [Chloroflexia bacterium]